MVRSINAYHWTIYDPARTLAALASVAKDLPVLVGYGLRLDARQSHDMKLVLPSKEGKPQLVEAWDRLTAALNEGGQVFRPAETRQINTLIDQLPAFGHGLLQLMGAAIEQSALPPPGAPRPEHRPLPGLFVLLEAERPEELARLVDRLEGTTAGLRIAMSIEGRAAAVLLADDASRAPLTASIEHRIPGAMKLSGYAAGELVVAVDAAQSPPASVLSDIAAIISESTSAQLFEPSKPPKLVCVRRAATSSVLTVHAFDDDLRVGSVIGGPQERFEIRLVRQSPSDADYRELARLLHEVRGGHRVALEPVPAWLRPTADKHDRLNQLNVQIRQLEDQRDRIANEGLPGETLLRFTVRQLLAFAAMLRRFSNSVIDSGGIGHAFQATGNDLAGVHYLLFDTAQVAPAFPLGEAFWRDKTSDDQEIAFWIDPGWASQIRRRAPQSRVFVPDGHVLTPTLFSFDDQDMDEYLRQAMVSWFPGTIERPDLVPRQAIYLFARAEAPGFDLRIEVLDRAAFKPYRQRLPWINDYLEYAASIGIERLMTAAGEQAFTERQVSELEKRAGAAEQALRSKAAALDAKLAEELAGYVARFGVEIGRIALRTQELTQLVDVLATRTLLLEGLAADVLDTTHATETRIHDLPAEVADLEQHRETMAATLSKLGRESEALIRSAEQRLGEKRAAIERLEKLVEKARRGRSR